MIAVSLSGEETIKMSGENSHKSERRKGNESGWHLRKVEAKAGSQQG